MSSLRDAAAEKAGERIPDGDFDNFSVAMTKVRERGYFVAGAEWAVSRVSRDEIAQKLYERDEYINGFRAGWENETEIQRDSWRSMADGVLELFNND